MKGKKFTIILLICFIIYVLTSGSYGYNQIIGTQAIGILQGCGGKCSVTQAAQDISALGSNMIKVSVSQIDKSSLDTILNMPFETYFFWWHSNGNWLKSFSDEARKKEYDETYQFAKKLLTQYKTSHKTFFIGHWEGDWYLLQKKEDGSFTEPTQAYADNMAAWLNIRQKAIDDARRDFPSEAKIYHYAEVNQVVDAIQNKKLRMANAVLHQTNVDYISYSAYDVQQKSQEEINATLNYLESQLPFKSSITGRRVFIGEMGMQARAVNNDQAKHEQVNRNIMLKFLRANVPYILYWQIYNNEIAKGGEQEGFWLIDNHNNKWPLWQTLNGLYQDQKNQPEKTRRERTIKFLMSL